MCFFSRSGVACEYYSCSKAKAGVARNRVCRANNFSKDGDGFKLTCCSSNEISSCIKGRKPSSFQVEKIDHLGLEIKAPENMFSISF